MSNTDKERILVLEANQKNIMEKIDSIIERFDRFEEKLDCALEKKANKWVENAISWTAYTVIGAVLLAGVYLVIK